MQIFSFFRNQQVGPTGLAFPHSRTWRVLGSGRLLYKGARS